jgi:bacillithiol system protein YtxJ
MGLVGSRLGFSILMGIGIGYAAETITNNDYIGFAVGFVAFLVNWGLRGYSYRDIHEIRTVDQWNALWNNTEEEAGTLIFKHSTSCIISAKALREYRLLLRNEADLRGWKPNIVRVIENREVSNQIAADTKVKHESPQVLLIHKGKLVWHASHAKVSRGHIAEAIREHRMYS